MMKRYLLTFLTLFPLGICSADELLTINHQRITEIASKHLLKNKPEIEENDLEARLINIVSHPKSGERHRAGISVEFILRSTEKMNCEPTPPEFLALLDEKARKEAPKELCTKDFKGYSVNFSSMDPN